MNGNPAQDYFFVIRQRHAPMPSTSNRKPQTGASTRQVRKKTNQITPRIRMASPVDAVSNASTDGPGSAWRASVGVSTIRPCSRVAMVASFQKERLGGRFLRTEPWEQRVVGIEVPVLQPCGRASPMTPEC